MSRIKITAVCVSLLATLFMVGCISSPVYHHGMHRGHVPSSFAHSHGCDPCGAVANCSCGSFGGGGVVTFGGGFCNPPRTAVDCKSAFANLTNGAFLTTRGILDITAAPFVMIGNLLSSNYRYEVMPYCKDVQVIGVSHHTIGACCSVGVPSSCDTCAGGFAEGIRYNVHPHHHQTTIVPPSPRRGNSVIQASHREPIPPTLRFVQPSHTAIR